LREAAAMAPTFQQRRKQQVLRDHDGFVAGPAGVVAYLIR
jgi:hypothetical protein